MLLNAKLANAIAGLNGSIPQGDGGEEPLIIVAAVAFVHHTHMVGLDDTEVLEGGATGNNMGFIALGKLHSNSQRDQLEVASFQRNILSGPKINPVGLTVDIFQGLDFIAKVVNLNCQSFLHFRLPPNQFDSFLCG